ncbi:uncharacterized protein PAC_06040 [Phialocephala subalpina]|uniref:Uncharacterized protein n=1 Tax=Phialocephala subalpina TaxID=576137 RepID=A0A1L7WTR2_9HELO|nr:uncharacterized protein PAC_06040 [Phialocephala subalpina]
MSPPIGSQPQLVVDTSSQKRNARKTMSPSPQKHSYSSLARRLEYAEKLKAKHHKKYAATKHESSNELPQESNSARSILSINSEIISTTSSSEASPSFSHFSAYQKNTTGGSAMDSMVTMSPPATPPCILSSVASSIRSYDLGNALLDSPPRNIFDDNDEIVDNNVNSPSIAITDRIAADTMATDEIEEVKMCRTPFIGRHIPWKNYQNPWKPIKSMERVTFYE